MRRDACAVRSPVDEQLHRHLGESPTVPAWCLKTRWNTPSALKRCIHRSL